MMMSSVLAAPTLSLVCLPALRAFNPNPESGTLYAPTMKVDPEMDLAPSKLVTDGVAAGDVDLLALLMLGEVSEVAIHLRKQQQSFPYPVPPVSAKGTPWFIDSYRPGSRGASGAASFSTQTPVRRVEMNQQNAHRTYLSYSIESAEGGFVQSIYIDCSSHVVSTDHYLVRIQAQNFSNALRLALLLSQEIYASGQYDTDNELGTLQYRVNHQGDWFDLFYNQGRFLPPDLPPDFHGELSFASAATVFADAHRDFRQAVVALDLMPLEPPRWQLEIALYRPLGRTLGLMPLIHCLRRLLWMPIFERIFAKS